MRQKTQWPVSHLYVTITAHHLNGLCERMAVLQPPLAHVLSLPHKASMKGHQADPSGQAQGNTL